MTSALNMLRACASVTDWLRKQGLEPPPSPVAEAILDGLGGGTPMAERVAIWNRIANAPWPTRIPNAALIQAGRGAYKTVIGLDLACHRLLAFDAAPYVSSGSEVVALTTAPSKRQAATPIRNARPRCERIAAAHGGRLRIRSATTEAADFVFEIPGLGYTPVLRVGAADEATIRGDAYVFVGEDEAGWFPGPDLANNAHALYVATSRLIQFPHSLFLMGSTNGPPAGMFFDWAQNTPAGVVKIGPLASWDVNPLMVESRIRAQYAPEIVAQEFECRTWGLRDAAFIPNAACLACLDQEGLWT